MAGESREQLPRVLVVDDDGDVLEGLTELLRRKYEVVGTSDPLEATAILRGDSEFALVLADQRMPGKTGVELLAHAAECSPETVRMLVTGYSDIEAVIDAINEGHVFRYVTKPWNPDELLAHVNAAVRTSLISRENVRLTVELRQAMEQVKTAWDRAESLERDESDLGARNVILLGALEDLRGSHWHLRRLQELLPICAYCGKVRTGDDYWQSVESYLRESSDFLTHGICPECMARLKADVDSGVAPMEAEEGRL